MPRGFTLLELMMTIAVLAVIAGIGVPSFVSIIESNRVQTQTNDFYTALLTARSEAVKRNQPVVICKSADQAACTTADNWEQGWLVYVDEDADETLDAGEPTVLTHDSLVGGLTLRAVNGSDDLLTYRPDGTLSSSEIFNVCLDADTANGKSIDLSVTGRPSRDKEATQCPA